MAAKPNTYSTLALAKQTLLWLFLIGILLQPKYIYAKISSATQIELVSICQFELSINGLVLLKMRITLLLIILTLAS